MPQLFPLNLARLSQNQTCPSLYSRVFEGFFEVTEDLVGSLVQDLVTSVHEGFEKWHSLSQLVQIIMWFEFELPSVILALAIDLHSNLDDHLCIHIQSLLFALCQNVSDSQLLIDLLTLTRMVLCFLEHLHFPIIIVHIFTLLFLNFLALYLGSCLQEHFQVSLIIDA